MLRVKVDAIKYATRWLEATHGRAALDEILAASPPGVRSALGRRVRGWRDDADLLALVDAADRTLGIGEETIAERIGVAIAAAQTKGIFRVVARVAAPDFLMRRCATAWKQLHQGASLEILSLDDLGCELELVGDPPRARFCDVQTGWLTEVGRVCHVESARVSGAEPIVRHVSCRSRDATRCLWDLRWMGAITREILATPLVPVRA